MRIFTDITIYLRLKEKSLYTKEAIVCYRNIHSSPCGNIMFTNLLVGRVYNISNFVHEFGKIIKSIIILL